MSKDWKEISTDEILNFDGTSTADIARYDRIMKQRDIEATNQLKAEVNELTETISKASQGAQEKYEAYSSSQSKQQMIIILLTVAIAVFTFFYTVSTWKSALAIKESNEIQRQFLEIEKKHLEQSYQRRLNDN